MTSGGSYQTGSGICAFDDRLLKVAVKKIRLDSLLQLFITWTKYGEGGVFLTKNLLTGSANLAVTEAFNLLGEAPEGGLAS